jgi:hypothetical protein
MLISAHKEDLLKEIKHQLALGPEGLLEEDRFLLECNFDELTSTTGKQQEYWCNPDSLQGFPPSCRGNDHTTTLQQRCHVVMGIFQISCDIIMHMFRVSKVT